MSWFRRTHGATNPEDEFGWNQSRFEQGSSVEADFTGLAATAGLELRTAVDPHRQDRCVSALQLVLDHGPVASQPWEYQEWAYNELVSFVARTSPPPSLTDGEHWVLPPQAARALALISDERYEYVPHLGAVNWPGVDLTGLNLSGVDLTGAQLTHAVLAQADLSGADLTGADLSGARLNGSNLSWAQLGNADLRQVTATRLSAPLAVLTGADLQDAFLADADLTSADLSGASLNGANLTRAELSGADLRATQFVSAKLTGATIEAAALAHADFTGAALEGTTLDGAQIPKSSGAYIALPGLKDYVDAYTMNRLHAERTMPLQVAAYDAATTPEEIAAAMADLVYQEFEAAPEIYDIDYEPGEDAAYAWQLDHLEDAGIAYYEHLGEKVDAAGAARGGPDQPDTRSKEQTWHDICEDAAPQTLDQHWPAVAAELARIERAGRDATDVLRTALKGAAEAELEPGQLLRARIVYHDARAAAQETAATAELAPADGYAAAAGQPIGVQHLELLQRRLRTAGALSAMSPDDDRTPAEHWRDIATAVAPYVVDEHWPSVEAALSRVQDAGGDPVKLLKTGLARTPEPGAEQNPGRGLHYRILAADPAAVSPPAQARTAAPDELAPKTAAPVTPAVAPARGPRL